MKSSDIHFPNLCADQNQADKIRAADSGKWGGEEHGFRQSEDQAPFPVWGHFCVHHFLHKNYQDYFIFLWDTIVFLIDFCKNIKEPNKIEVLTLMLCYPQVLNGRSKVLWRGNGVGQENHPIPQGPLPRTALSWGHWRSLKSTTTLRWLFYELNYDKQFFKRIKWLIIRWLPHLSREIYPGGKF